MSDAEKYVHVLLDSNRGQYIPQGFAERVDLTICDDITAKDHAILLKGPGSFDEPADPDQGQVYWDTWNDVEMSVKVWWDGRGNDKKPYTLFTTENGDVLLVREDVFYCDVLDEWRYVDDQLTLSTAIDLAFRHIDGWQFQSMPPARKIEVFKETLDRLGFDLDTMALD